MTSGDPHTERRPARAVLGACLCLLLALFPGCERRPGPAELGQLLAVPPKTDPYPDEYPLPELDSQPDADPEVEDPPGS